MIEAGTILQDRYLVSEHIGAGGMGAVYVGTDQRFGSTVAIKETFFTDESLRRAFEREARLLNSLRHPALARVSDHFVDGNGQFLVMEYIPGDDLSELMAKRGSAFPIPEVMTWADQLLDALDYLHTQEMPVVHRDIKPQNLKLTPRGQIILLDFGLAKGNPTDSGSQSNTKSIFGYSRAYAPLEQIQGTGTDPRSDFYSLAATIYHLMTGVPPEDALARGTAVLNGNPDPLGAPHLLRPEISPAVSAVIVKAMALNANFRPSSAAAMRALLLDAKNNIADLAEQETVAIPAAAGIFDQQTQVIGGENTAVGASPTEHNRAVVSGDAEQIPLTEHNRAFVSGDPQISIPLTELTRVSEGPKRSRALLGVGAAAAALILVACSAYGLYLYKPEIFHQNGAVNSVSTEKPVQNDPPANTANTETQPEIVNSSFSKETGAKTTDAKDGKTAGEKTAAKSDTVTAANSAAAANSDATTENEVNTKQKALEEAVQKLVNRRLQQANIRRQQANADPYGPDAPPPGARIYPRNLPPPRKPYVFRRKRPNP